MACAKVRWLESIDGCEGRGLRFCKVVRVGVLQDVKIDHGVSRCCFRSALLMSLEYLVPSISCTVFWFQDGLIFCLASACWSDVVVFLMGQSLSSRKEAVGTI